MRDCKIFFAYLLISAAGIGALVLLAHLAPHVSK